MGKRFVLATALALALGATAGAQEVAPIQGVIYGMSPQGAFAAMGNGIADIIRRAYPGSSLTYEPGNTAGNIVKLADGDGRYAFLSPVEMETAIRGEAPFERAYDRDDFHGVARVVQGFALQVYARQAFLDQYGIESFADLAAKRPPLRISTSTKGNVAAQVLAKRLLAHFGIDYADIERWGGRVDFLPTPAGNDALRNGNLDMVVTAGLVPSSLVMEVSRNVPIRMLPLPEDLNQKMAAELGTDIVVIPADAYAFLDENLSVPSISYLLIAGPAAQDEESYRIVRALHRDFAAYRRVHPVLQSMQIEDLPRVAPYALQPGAARFFEEAGLQP